MDLTELNKYKNKIFNIAVIILALIFASNIYKKQARDIEALKGMRDVEIKKNKALDSISQLEKKINAYKNLFTKKDASLVINTTGNIAKELGIRIVSIRPGAEQRYPDYIKLPFDLVVSSFSYHTLGKFISKLESCQYVYVIEVVDIKFESQTGELRVNLKLNNIVTTN